jgi:hypothetical protein
MGSITVSINTRTRTLTIFVILPLLSVQIGDLLLRLDRMPIQELAKTVLRPFGGGE